MQRGLTLVELLVALAIGSVLLVAAAAAIRVVITSVVQQPLALGQIDQARGAAAAFVNELRDATYGADGSYPLVQASTTQIIFFSPYLQNGAAVDRIRYFIASSTLYKGVTRPTGTSYVLANEKVTPVVRSLLATTSAAFTYYNGSYAGATTSVPLTQPVSLSEITFVQLTLGVYTQERRNATSTFTVMIGSSIRNLKTNLGS